MRKLREEEKTVRTRGVRNTYSQTRPAQTGDGAGILAEWRRNHAFGEKEKVSSEKKDNHTFARAGTGNPANGFFEERRYREKYSAFREHHEWGESPCSERKVKMAGRIKRKTRKQRGAVRGGQRRRRVREGGSPGGKCPKGGDKLTGADRKEDQRPI